jgi:uncharacterized membrane protein YGL010W
MSTRKSADAWFAAYGASHQHRTNELIHWFCVPVIFVSVMGFVWSLPVPEAWLEEVPWFNWVLVAMALVMVFYVRLSPALSAGLLFFMSIGYMVVVLLALYARWPVWTISVAAFALAWIGQFIGHRIEGKRPSFFQDLVFLLIGPAWLLSMAYRKIGQKY